MQNDRSRSGPCSDFVQPIVFAEVPFLDHKPYATVIGHTHMDYILRDMRLPICDHAAVFLVVFGIVL